VEAAIAGILSLNVLRLGTYEILPGLSSTGPIIGANLLRQSLLGSQMDGSKRVSRSHADRRAYSSGPAGVWPRKIRAARVASI
jgi:hypothetical protein